MTAPADSRISDELLPCPFCGWKAEVVSGGPGNHFVQCKGCRATSDDRHIDSAVAAWNRRALITELRERRAQAAAVKPTTDIDAKGLEAARNAYLRGDSVDVVRRVIAAYLTVAAPPPAQAVTVKPLEFESVDSTRMYAAVRSLFTGYRITLRSDGWKAVYFERVGADEPVGTFPDWDTAKEAAQVDFNTRVGIAAPPPAQAAGVTEADASLLRYIVMPMVQERSREPGDAWDSAAKVLEALTSPSAQDREE